MELKRAGLRVDGLGKTLRTQNPQQVPLEETPVTDVNLVLKRAAISRYLFNLAFENAIEPGYVTEKVFDALIAGR